jgi:hypothetical protein
MNIKPVLDTLDEALADVEGNKTGDVNTEEGDRIAGLRDYLENTATDDLNTRAVAEIAYAFLAGIEHASGYTHESRPAYAAIRKAGLNL